MDEELVESLKLCGFGTGERQESRLMSILGVILRIQEFPSIPITFAEIHEKFQRDDPNTKLTKAWLHRVLKTLVDLQLIRVDNPKSHRKRYIADVNTIVTGLERLKSNRVEELETRGREINEELTKISALDCGYLSKELISNVTGRQEELGSRIVRGVKELHRVIRYNMLDIAGEGDIIRATVLWIEPFIDDDIRNRTGRFMDAAEKDAEVRYLVSSDIFQIEQDRGIRLNTEDMISLMETIAELKKSGKKFDIRIYVGPRTYNHVCFNKESMALIIAENPVTATWITRKFNLDLIDNAVESFDKAWEKGKSIFDFTPKDFLRFGYSPKGLKEESNTTDSDQ